MPPGHLVTACFHGGCTWTWAVCPASQAHSRRAHRETTRMTATGSAPGQGSQKPQCAPSPGLRSVSEAQDRPESPEGPYRAGRPCPARVCPAHLADAACRTHTHLDHVLDAAVGMLFNHGLDPDQGLDLSGRGRTARSPSHFTKLPFTGETQQVTTGPGVSPVPGSRGSWENPSRCQDGSEQRKNADSIPENTLGVLPGRRGSGAKGPAPLRVWSLVLTSRPLGAQAAPGALCPPHGSPHRPETQYGGGGSHPEGRGGLLGRGGGGSLGPRRWRPCTHVGVEAVGHELELAVGWDEGDGAVILKARQPHALVELHVLQLHGLAFATCREPECEGMTDRP